MTDGDPGNEQPVICAWCGTVAPDGAPLEWTMQTGERGRGIEHLCGECSRANLRSIEARLDAEWW